MNENNRFLADLLTAAGLSRTIPYYTERRYLDHSDDVVPFSNVAPNGDDISWLIVKKVSKPKDKDMEFYMSAIQKILLACAIPNSKLLFLVTGSAVYGQSVFIGIEGGESQKSINMLKNFIIGTWPGIQPEIIDDINHPQLEMLSKYIAGDKEGNGDEIRYIGAVTGIPSMETQYETIYPSTIDHLIDGIGQSKMWAYFVVATPVFTECIDEILYKCRHLLGQAKSLQTINVTNSETTGTTEQYASVQEKDVSKITDTLCNMIPSYVPMKERIAQILSGIAASLPPIGVLLPSKTSIPEMNQNSVTNSMSQTITNSHIEAVVEHLTKHSFRFEEGKATGMWTVNTYLMSLENEVFINGKQQLKAILSGAESKYEPIRIHDLQLSEKREGLSKFRLPNIEIRNRSNEVISHPFGKPFEYLSSVLTTKELSSFINFPLKSVPGIPVREVTAFGRNVFNKAEENKKICLGNILYMGLPEANKVELNMDSLVKHAFITGTTGSGKSNTLYLMLEKLREENKKFLVIEPAKGEYRKVFGLNLDVQVYSCIPEKRVKMLKINPFQFPSRIHVYEHIDSLVEIFNACWPMYAAMPVVLKHAIEEAYKSCGWDMIHSNSKYGLFPTINDVKLCLNRFIEKSRYSGDTKSDYIGALETRLVSLSEGLNEIILCSNNPISDADLFDKSAVVDLSRLGSSETKALLMGLLIMKLKEYRMANTTKTNNVLKHVTVLEEAHHLLRRVSTQQTQEGSNLLGKSVEMITNGIAEMRTYGEGFIIVDQSPSMLDLAAIRNTNTKIVLSLPEAEDKEVAGKSMGLTEEQITEISRLKRGEAIIYQNEWEEAVMCNIKLFKSNVAKANSDKHSNSDVEEVQDASSSVVILNFLFTYCRDMVTDRKKCEKLELTIKKAPFPSTLKFDLLELVANHKETQRCDLSEQNHVKVMELMTRCLDCNKDIDLLVSDKMDIKVIDKELRTIVCNIIHGMDDDFYRFCVRCLLRSAASKSKSNVVMYNDWLKLNRYI